MAEWWEGKNIPRLALVQDRDGGKTWELFFWEPGYACQLDAHLDLDDLRTIRDLIDKVLDGD